MTNEVQNASSWIAAAYTVGFVILTITTAYLVVERRRLKNLLKIANDQN